LPSAFQDQKLHCVEYGTFLLAGFSAGFFEASMAFQKPVQLLIEKHVSDRLGVWGATQSAQDRKMSVRRGVHGPLEQGLQGFSAPAGTLSYIFGDFFTCQFQRECTSIHPLSQEAFNERRCKVIKMDRIVVP
jgi:hypothetical protein